MRLGYQSMAPTHEGGSERNERLQEVVWLPARWEGSLGRARCPSRAPEFVSKSFGDALESQPALGKPEMRLLGTRIEVHNYPHSDQVRQASRLQLLDNVGAVQLDGSKANAEMAGDDLVGLARGD
jgi:hypothetical protein